MNYSEHFAGMTAALLALGASLVCGCTGEAASEAADPEEVAAEQADAAQFEQVDLDQFIAEEVEAAGKFEGQKLIKMAAPVRFVAKMKRKPEPREVTYVYTALEVANVSPLPTVEHRMFVETAEGHIIPVYVEQQIAQKLSEDLEAEESAQFFGHHLYSYAKGPAILVVDFAKE